MPTKTCPSVLLEEGENCAGVRWWRHGTVTFNSCFFSEAKMSETKMSLLVLEEPWEQLCAVQWHEVYFSKMWRVTETKQKHLKAPQSRLCSDNIWVLQPGLLMSLSPEKSIGDFMLLILQTTKKSSPCSYLKLQLSAKHRFLGSLVFLNDRDVFLCLYSVPRYHTTNYLQLTQKTVLFTSAEKAKKFLNPDLFFLQLIPQISSLAWFTTVVPLVLVLAVSGVKDAIDDFVRLVLLSCTLDFAHHSSAQSLKQTTQSKYSQLWEAGLMSSGPDEIKSWNLFIIWKSHNFLITEQSIDFLKLFGMSENVVTERYAWKSFLRFPL